MIVAHYRPDEGKGVGGLDAAIDAMTQWQRRAGAEIIEVGAPPVSGPPAAAIHHFHGLWHPWHSDLTRILARDGHPYVVSPHGMLEPWAFRHKFWKKLPYFHLRERGHLARAARLIATAAPEAANLAGHFPRTPVETIPLGRASDTRPDHAAARAALGWSGDPRRTILYLSRLHEKKGLHLLLEAMAPMHLGPFCRLVVVGDGDPDYVRRVRDLAETNRRTLPRIDWLGAIWGEGKWPFLQAADLFCLPTHSENFALAVLEALQVGTPVLTTTGTPWGDLAAGRDGVVVTEPEIESIRRGLLRFVTGPPWSPERREALADWAHATFHWGHLADHHLSLYGRVVGESSRAGYSD